jgi:hypothetical protein
MNNFKPAIITGIFGFGLSLLVALVSGVRLPMLVLRPLIFGGVFFAFGVASLHLYRRFLAVPPGNQNESGNNIDISVGDGEDDAGMMIGDADMRMDFTGFTETDASSQNEISSGQEYADIDHILQDGEGLEQKSTISYTGDESGAGKSFKPMDFYNLKGDIGDTPRVAVPSSVGGQKVYARVPEKGRLVDADPKKLASTVQDLLSDE